MKKGKREGKDESKRQRRTAMGVRTKDITKERRERVGGEGGELSGKNF